MWTRWASGHPCGCGLKVYAYLYVRKNHPENRNLRRVWSSDEIWKHSNNINNIWDQLCQTNVFTLHFSCSQNFEPLLGLWVLERPASRPSSTGLMASRVAETVWVILLPTVVAGLPDRPKKTSSKWSTCEYWFLDVFGIIRLNSVLSSRRASFFCIVALWIHVFTTSWIKPRPEGGAVGEQYRNGANWEVGCQSTWRSRPQNIL